jgi:hypothetical protein
VVVYVVINETLASCTSDRDQSGNDIGKVDGSSR